MWDEQTCLAHCDRAAKTFTSKKCLLTGPIDGKCKLMEVAGTVAACEASCETERAVADCGVNGSGEEIPHRFLTSCLAGSYDGGKTCVKPAETTSCISSQGVCSKSCSGNDITECKCTASAGVCNRTAVTERAVALCAEPSWD